MSDRRIRISIFAEPSARFEISRRSERAQIEDRPVGEIVELTEDQILKSGGLTYLQDIANRAVRDFWKTLKGES